MPSGRTIDAKSAGSGCTYPLAYRTRRLFRRMVFIWYSPLSSEFFDFTADLQKFNEVDQVLRKGETNMVIIIPSNFGSDLNSENHSQIQLITDGTNPNLASALVNYASAIIMDFQSEFTNINAIGLPLSKIRMTMHGVEKAKADYTLPLHIRQRIPTLSKLEELV